MGFYHLNLFNLLLLAMICTIAIFLFWLFWTKGLGRNFTGPVVWVAIAAILVAPWIEEFWIAYHFGQACKDAGIVIYKKVEVDGYYDDTGGGTMTRLVGGPPYKFIESRERDGKFRRVEHASAEEKADALAWYAKNNSGNSPGVKEWITHRVNDRLQVTVEMDTGYAWRITTLDRPTAKYHYTKPHSHTVIGHKISIFEYVVRDSEMDKVLARERTYAREAPWYFIGLDTPTRFCPVSGTHGERIHATIYDLALEPTRSR